MHGIGKIFTLTEISTSSTFDAWPWCCKNETHLHASLAICGGYATPDYLQVHIFIRVHAGHCPVHGTGTSRSGRGLIVCWLTEDRLRRGYKAHLPPPHANGYVRRTDLRSRAQ